MNIFVLDYDPKVAAISHCDKHVVKMILESAQIMCTVQHKLGVDDIPYRATHHNHPCTIWAGESQQNYEWLYQLAEALHDEWQYRFNHGEDDIHKSWQVIKDLPTPDLPDIGMTKPRMAMPEEYHNDDVVTAYRTYYINDKADLLQYTKRNKPNWSK